MEIYLLHDWWCLGTGAAEGHDIPITRSLCALNSNNAFTPNTEKSRETPHLNDAHETQGHCRNYRTCDVGAVQTRCLLFHPHRRWESAEFGKDHLAQVIDSP